MADTINLTYLNDLVGRVVKINKAGPDLKTGKLLQVNDDYLTLQTKEQQVVYFQLKHVKAVVEDTKGNVNPTDYPELSFYEEDTKTVGDLLGQLLQGSVQINGGGPASRVGRLLAVNDEFLTLETKKDGLVLYHLDHIKSVNEVELKEKENESVYELEPAFAEAVTLPQLFAALKRQWVTVNNGPDKIEGVLSEFDDETLVIVHDKEVYYVSTFHLQSIVVPIQGREDEVSEDEKSDSDSTNSNENSQNHTEKSSKSQTRRNSKSNVYRKILMESIARSQAAINDRN